MVNLIEPIFSKKNMEPHSQITNKKKVNFPSLCRIHRSTADLPCRVAESVFPTEKEEHVIRLRWSQRDHQGGPSAILSLENSLSVGFTGHCSLSSWQQRGGRHCAGWMVCGPLSSAPSPALPSPCALAPVLPQGPCLLRSGLQAVL